MRTQENQNVTPRPRLCAYIHDKRGPFQDRQAFGVAVVVTDGSFEDLYAGFGYARDGDFPRLAAVSHILSAYPDSALDVHVVGIMDKLGHWRKGRGLKADGSAFVGGHYLAEIAEAIDRRRISFWPPPSAHEPPYVRAKTAAQAGCADLMARPDTLNHVEVVRCPNTILSLAKVGGDAQGRNR